MNDFDIKHSLGMNFSHSIAEGIAGGSSPKAIKEGERKFKEEHARDPMNPCRPAKEDMSPKLRKLQEKTEPQLKVFSPTGT